MHDGIAQMFHVIEYARMGVGTKAMATLSTGYLNALDTRKERMQGADLLRAADKTAPRVEIIQHPDVRRMLMLQKAFAEGLRAIVPLHRARPGPGRVARRHGGQEARPLDALNDLMLPLIKGYGSEKVYELLALSLQTFGGSGYCRTIRSSSTSATRRSTRSTRARRDPGARPVLPQDRPGQRAGAGHVAGEIRSSSTAEAGNGQLKEERALLAAALADVQGMLAHVDRLADAPGEDPRASTRSASTPSGC